MSHSQPPFVFFEEKADLTADEYILRLPTGITYKADLLSAYAERGHFPAYFGNNWDALNDCLRDFSWVNQDRIIIIHDDLPLSDNEGELSKYLDILEAAVEFWRGRDEHELIVCFLARTKTTIARLLN